MTYLFSLAIALPFTERENERGDATFYQIGSERRHLAALNIKQISLRRWQKCD